MMKKGSSYFWPEIEGISPVWVVYKSTDSGQQEMANLYEPAWWYKTNVSYQEGKTGRSQVPGLFWATE